MMEDIPVAPPVNVDYDEVLDLLLSGRVADQLRGKAST